MNDHEHEWYWNCGVIECLKCSWTKQDQRNAERRQRDIKIEEERRAFVERRKTEGEA